MELRSGDRASMLPRRRRRIRSHEGSARAPASAPILRLGANDKGGSIEKETAFYGRLEALTDQWMDLFGYWAPTVVTDTREEYRAVRENAGLMDFSMLRKVDIDGPGAQAFINTMVARDVAELEPGRIAYGPLTDEDGLMVDDCTVIVRSADSIRFCGANDRDHEIFGAKAPDGVTVREFTDAMPHLCLQGPKSREMAPGAHRRRSLERGLPLLHASGRTSRSPESRCS